jgi:hypothetical protein
MSSKTVHKITTPHGYNTPHKYPNDDDPRLNVLKSLATQLYPTGRAWFMPEDSLFRSFHEALDLSFLDLIEDGNLLLNQTFPDNDDFSEDDARLWEFRLGLITNDSVDLEIRKQVIKRKMGHPNNIKARQHPLFIESQLQAAGFKVWVHENTIPYRTPLEVSAIDLDNVNHGEPTQHGVGTTHGGGSFSLIANSINAIESYSIGGDENLWATFFIGGIVLGTSAEVQSSRLKEFKELVIKLKPAHTVAFTFINYV